MHLPYSFSRFDPKEEFYYFSRHLYSKNNNDVESENIYNIPKNDFNQQPQQQSAT